MTVPRRLAYILFLLLCLLTAQGSVVRHFNPDDGMTGNSVFRFFKDSGGLVWVGTNIGVCSYDGSHITNYSIDCTSPRSIVHDIVQMPSGQILLACPNGLYSVDRKRQACQRICPTIESATSFCLMGDTLYVGSGQGLWIYTTKGEPELITVEDDAFARGNHVNGITPDGKGGLWVVTDFNLLHVALPSRAVTWMALPPLDGHLTCVEQAQGLVYVGTFNEGLLCVDPATRLCRTCPLGTQGRVITDLHADGPDRILVATDGGGAYVCDVREHRILAHHALQPDNGDGIALPTNAVYTFWHDRELDTYWMGFYEEGFTHTLQSQPFFRLYDNGQKAGDAQHMRSFAIHGDDRVLSLRHGLLYINAARGLNRLFTPQETGFALITNIVWFSGRYIISTYGHGLYCLDPQRLTLSNAMFPLLMRRGRFGRLQVTDDGNTLVAASDLGLFFIGTDLRTRLKLDSKNSQLPDAYIYDFLFDGTGKGWIATTERMSLYDPRTQTVQTYGFKEHFFNDAGELSFNLCRNGDILAISRRQVWRVTPDLKRITPTDIYDRLPGVRQITFITQAPDSLFWVATDRGLFLFDHDFGGFRAFGQAEGITAPRFNKQEFCWSGDTLWLGNQRGILCLTPGDYARLAQRRHQPIVITRMQAGTRACTPQQMLTTNRKGRVRLGWNIFNSIENRLSLEPLELNYAGTLGSYFCWTLDSRKATPTVLQAGGRITLENLSLGRHTLRVWAAGCPDTMLTLRITVLPSLSACVQTALFLLAVLLACVIVRMWRRRTELHRLRQRKHQLDLQLTRTTLMRDMERKRLEDQRQQQMEKQQSLYGKSRLSDDELSGIYRNMCGTIQRERLFARQDLRLSDVASATGIASAHLSQTLNVYAKTNFSDFLNGMRVNEFKRLVADPNLNHYTISALSEMCGFRHSNFFASFKRFEGCTPTEYLRQQGITR